MDENTVAFDLWKRLKRELKIETTAEQDEAVVIDIATALAKVSGSDVLSHTTVYNPIKVSQQLSSLATQVENKTLSTKRVITRLRAIAEKIKSMP